jgi:type 1 glutamine amidotransferase
MRWAVAPMLVVMLFGAAPAATPAPAPTPSFRVLAFTKTTGYRHGSITDAVAAIANVAAQNGFALDQSEDSSVFNDANLARYKVIAFLLTTGDILDADQQAAMERFIRAGGGYVGVHSAVDTEYEWPWYGALVGAYFTNHPAIQQATINVTDANDPSTAHLPRTWVRTDEWYNFRTNPRANVNVLATIDESTYDPGPDAMGADHPIAWSHPYDGGRAWYTAGGHTFEAWYEPLFVSHVVGGIKWAAGPLPAVTPTPATAAKPAPKIVSLKTALKARRVVATVKHTACSCKAQLSVRVRGRMLKTKQLAVKGTTTRLTSAVLPKGRWQLSVTLTGPPAGTPPKASSAVGRRWVTVR